MRRRDTKLKLGITVMCWHDCSGQLVTTIKKEKGINERSIPLELPQIAKARQHLSTDDDLHGVSIVKLPDWNETKRNETKYSPSILCMVTIPILVGLPD